MSQTVKHYRDEAAGYFERGGRVSWEVALRRAVYFEVAYASRGSVRRYAE